jgi:hypothetical protein
LKYQAAPPPPAPSNSTAETAANAHFNFDDFCSTLTSFESLSCLIGLLAMTHLGIGRCTIINRREHGQYRKQAGKEALS